MNVSQTQRRWIALAVLLCIGLLSFGVIGRAASSSEWKFNADTIQSLDEKKATVMELTAASTAASVVISMMPGDAGSAIADKLADFSGYFLIVLCAIYLEKYLLTITGFLAFKILIPCGCALLGLWLFWRKDALVQIAVKAFLFGLAVFFIVPTSQWTSSFIEATYRSSIEDTLQAARETTEEIEAASEASDAESEPASGEGASDSTQTSKGILGSISSFLDKGAEAVQEGASALTEGAANLVSGASDLREKAEHVLNRFVESLAILLVTSCLIPIAVILFYIWLVKVILGIRIDLPGAPKLSQR